MKKRIHPLSQAIEAYGQGKAAEISQEDIPSEFDETVVSFRRLLDQLDQARREKERVYQEKQTLIADISHDLRTPLTVIQGYTEALEEGKVPPEKVGQYRKAILTKSRLATDLVSDLFLFTQMEHPDYPMQGETANFGAFVRTFFAEKYLDLTEQGFCLQADLPDPPVPLWFDAKLMRRLLENLLGNAMKHNPRGTTLYVVLTQTEEAVHLTIADDGVGISPDLAATLFQPFVTGNHARTTGKGTGAGPVHCPADRRDAPGKDCSGVPAHPAVSHRIFHHPSGRTGETGKTRDANASWVFSCIGSAGQGGDLPHFREKCGISLETLRKAEAGVKFLPVFWYHPNQPRSSPAFPSERKGTNPYENGTGIFGIQRRGSPPRCRCGGRRGHGHLSGIGGGLP